MLVVRHPSFCSLFLKQTQLNDLSWLSAELSVIILYESLALL